MSRAPAIRFHAAKSKAAASRNTALPGLEDKSPPRRRERRSHVRDAEEKVARLPLRCSYFARGSGCVLGENPWFADSALAPRPARSAVR